MEGASVSGAFRGYDPQGRFCEMLGPDGTGLPHTRAILERFDRIGLEVLRQRARDAEIELYDQGITFTVYSDR